MARIFFILSIIFIIGISVISGTGCANIIPPSGGPRDSIPPVLEKASPRDSSKNFSERRISFVFDEFVNLQNAQQELLVSPILKNTPEVTYKLNTVTVRIKDSLESNTTYTLDFGNSIKDFNEGNVLKNFVYTFSTGNYFDSLQFSGKVILAETGKTDTTLIVMLHSSADDSAVVSEKPRYVTKLDGKGNFHFKNLPPKTYYLYALKDEGGSYRYFGDKLFAFADEPVTISTGTKPVTLYAWASQKAQEKNITTPATTIGLGNKLNRGNNPAADRRLRFSTNLINNQQDLLGDFVITFEQALRSYDSTKIGLFTDTSYLPVKDYRFVKDSSNKKLQLQINWKEGTAYHLVLDKDFAEDSTGKKLLKSDTISFTTKRLAEYGKLKLRLRNVDLAKNPVLQFVMGGNITQSIPLDGNELNRAIFLPGEYELRVLYDANKNGKWDTGQFFGKHKQPEIVVPIERKITIKPNWENEFEVSL